MPVVANVTARPTSEVETIRNQLVEQVTGMVRWRECVLTMKELGVDTMVEIGAGKVLSGLGRRNDADLGTMSVGTPETIEEFLNGL